MVQDVAEDKSLSFAQLLSVHTKSTVVAYVQRTCSVGMCTLLLHLCVEDLKAYLKHSFQMVCGTPEMPCVGFILKTCLICRHRPTRPSEALQPIRAVQQLEGEGQPEESRLSRFRPGLVSRVSMVPLCVESPLPEIGSFPAASPLFKPHLGW